ncbi:MAG: RICIN domain-containing protein [Planctomycetes bacterium]|nr:RICIN domain-containing protein [Planctomycetota bacterium]
MRRLLIGLVVALLAFVGFERASADDRPDAHRIAEAFRYVTGREPTAEELSLNLYENWSSYNDLCNKMRAKYTTQGAAYVFIKPNQAAGQGHIGWAVMANNGTYLCGSTENPFESDHPEKAMYIAPGEPNKFWMKLCTTEQEMLQTMAQVTTDGSSGYWHYKVTTVLTRDYLAARAAAYACRDAGFEGVGNNCLDHTLRVLQAYGTGKSDTDWGRVLPVINQWKIGARDDGRPIYFPVPGFTKITPNDWFNNFGYILNGRASSGNGHGTALPGVGSSLVSFQTVGQWFSGEMSLYANRDEPGCIRLQPSDHTDNAQWFFNPADNAPGYYLISNRGMSRDENGKWLVLDVPGGSTDCVLINLYPHHGGDNQLWSLEPWPTDNPDRYAIRNKMTNQYLTIEGGRMDAGARLCQYKDVGHSSQRFKLR